MLTPGPAGAWVTSEHASVVAVNTRAHSLIAVTADGRVLDLDHDAIGAERLAHAYAVTVHRCQGVTSDTAHVLEHGGGRELAYVAMSRARTSTHVYVPAASVDDAAEQLRWAWASERRQRWAHDQGQPQPDVRQPLREYGRLDKFINRQVFASTAGAGVPIVARRTQIEAEIAELEAGTGRHAHTAEGHAARALAAAERALSDARRDAGDTLGPFAHRRARKAVAEREAERDHAGRLWNQLVSPELGRLRDERDQTFTSGRSRFEERDAWLAEHPAIGQRLKDLARQIGEHPERDVRRDVDKTHGQAMDLGL